MENKPKPQTFTIEDCETILQNTLRTKDVKYLNQKSTSLFGNVEGYLSEHFLLEIKYVLENHEHVAKYFVKSLLEQPGFLAELASYLEVFHIESFFYKTLVKEFGKLENFTQFAPECFFVRQNLLVLEDLCQQGFEVNERLKRFNLEQCRVVLKTLSIFHGCGIAHEELKKKKTASKYRLDQQYPEEFEDKFYSHKTDTPSMQFFLASNQCLVDLIDEIPSEIIPDKKGFKENLRALESVTDENNICERYRCTCVHGDLWANNIMFKYDNERSEIIDCRLLDFQFIRYYLPAFDVLLLLFGNTTQEFRKENLASLLSYYYDCLKSELTKYDLELVDIMSVQNFMESTVYAAPSAIMQAFSDYSLLCLPEEVLEEAQSNPTLYKSFLIDFRSKYVLDIYRNNETFRKYAETELKDMYRLLNEKKELDRKYS